MEPFELSSTDEGTMVGLQPILDIRVADALKQTFLEAAEAGKPVTIDATMVERIFTPCIQVILAATEALEEKEVAFSFKAPTEAFVSAFDELGLFPTMMKWKVVS